MNDADDLMEVAYPEPNYAPYYPWRGEIDEDSQQQEQEQDLQSVGVEEAEQEEEQAQEHGRNTEQKSGAIQGPSIQRGAHVPPKSSDNVEYQEHDDR